MTHAVSEITNFCIVLLFPLSCFINLIYGMSTSSCFRTEWIVMKKTGKACLLVFCWEQQHVITVARFFMLLFHKNYLYKHWS